jgi:hypothetical protein
MLKLFSVFLAADGGFEDQRRRIFTDLKEVSYYMNDKLKQLINELGNDNQKSSSLLGVKTEFNNRIR